MASLTFVVPTYNEAHRWRAAYWEDLLLLDGIQWIFVDDGSTDNSYERLNQLPHPSKYQVLRLGSNRGKGEAVRAGMIHAIDSYDAENRHEGANSEEPRKYLLGFLDADGSIDKADIIRLWMVAKSRIDCEDPTREDGLSRRFDTVWASRVGMSGREIRRRLSRHYLGRAINSLLGIFIAKIPYDPQCGLKIFKPSLQLRDTLDRPFKTHWFFDLEIMLNWEKVNGLPLQIWEQPLDSWHEVAGSHLSFRNTFRVAREIAQVALEGRRLARSKERGKENGS